MYNTGIISTASFFSGLICVGKRNLHSCQRRSKILTHSLTHYFQTVTHKVALSYSLIHSLITVSDGCLSVAFSFGVHPPPPPPPVPLSPHPRMGLGAYSVYPLTGLTMESEILLLLQEFLEKIPVSIRCGGTVEPYSCMVSGAL